VDDEGVVAIRPERAPRVVESQLGERRHTDLFEQPAEPFDEVIAGVQTVVQRERGGVRGHSEVTFDPATLFELRVVDGVDEVTQLGERLTGAL
jgi:hypothetical protein